MPTALPLEPSIANYRVGTTLAGTPYLLDVRWNSREGAWYMDVLSDDATIIASGLKLVLGVIIGNRIVAADFPLGVFVAADLSNTGIDAAFDDMGTRVQVYFYDFTEFAGVG